MADRVAVMADGAIVQEGDPREVYGKPRTSFVASFLGGANFLSATVAESSDDVVLGHGEGRLTLRLPSACAPNEEVEVVIRPEEITVHLSEPSEAVNVLAGVVERLTFQGGQAECRVRVGGEVLRALLHPAVRIAVRDRVWLVIDPERCVVLRKERA
jgi:ABC-type Fe3+/spermidine/putrescine transport system ATPase subunit